MNEKNINQENSSEPCNEVNRHTDAFSLNTAAPDPTSRFSPNDLHKMSSQNNLSTSAVNEAGEVLAFEPTNELDKEPVNEAAWKIRFKLRQNAIKRKALQKLIVSRRRWNALPWWLRDPVNVLFSAADHWVSVNGPQLGASIAFYTMFALAPLLIIMIAVAGAVFGADAARGEIVGEIQGIVGPTAARAIQDMIETAWVQPGGTKAAIAAVITMLIGATGVFGELRRTLNIINGVVPVQSSINAFVRVRLIAFALLLGFGFLAIASLVLSAAVASSSRFLSSRYAFLTIVGTGIDVVISIAVLSVAFAALLRWLPDKQPSRSALWVSAIASSVMFTLGKSLIGMYLGRASISSSYGAAGSFVVVMLWVYYSSQIMLYGAAIGRKWAERVKSAPLECGNNKQYSH